MIIKNCENKDTCSINNENNKIDLKSEVTAAKDYEAAIFAYKFFSNKDVAEDNKEVSEHLTKFIKFRFLFSSLVLLLQFSECQ